MKASFRGLKKQAKAHYDETGWTRIRGVQVCTALMLAGENSRIVAEAVRGSPPPSVDLDERKEMGLLDRR